MRIVNLTERRYREFARLNDKDNFGQTTEYSKIITNRHKRNLFLGLLDDNDELLAAALILIRNVSTLVKEAVAPNGYLIDYNDLDLVKTFTLLLKERLLKEGVTYLITNPMFKYKVYNKYNVPIEDNEDAYKNLIDLHYHSIGYYSEFEKYDVILENTNSIVDIYKNFNRNTKRNIKDAMRYGITLHRGTINDLNTFYDIIKKKTTKKYAFFESIMNIYNTEDNLAELYFVKFNPHNYLINSKAIYEKIRLQNKRINKKFNKYSNNINEHLLNKKMNSDKTFEKYRDELDKAIKLDAEYEDDIIIGTSLIIRNNHEIYFLIDGYKEEYRHIHGTHILKWGLIRKYFDLGYRIFNLGEIHNNYLDQSSKYYNQYRYKIGFGGNIIEYTPNLIYIVNKPMYKLFMKKNHKKH